MAVTIRGHPPARASCSPATWCAPPSSTPPKLSEITGAEIYVKFENLQVTNSFKDRGAYVKLQSLTAAERARGVIAMSAGNHAQAVAYHAKRLGIPATIVMPETTPSTKVERTRAHGAQVMLSGRNTSPTARSPPRPWSREGHGADPPL